LVLLGDVLEDRPDQGIELGVQGVSLKRQVRVKEPADDSVESSVNSTKGAELGLEGAGRNGLVRKKTPKLSE
jgi:hypothetical protein